MKPWLSLLNKSVYCFLYTRMLSGGGGLQVRRKLVGNTEPSYSQYTCYTGIADFTPPDIDTVGYRVFLGNGKYFVSSDVGGGKMQWCAAGSKHACRRASVAFMA